MTQATALVPPPEVWRAINAVPSRLCFQFSATGRTGAALAAAADGTASLERWRLSGPGPRCEALEVPWAGAEAVTAADAAAVKAHPFDDGYLLVMRGRADRQALTGLPPDGSAPEPVGVIDHPQAVLVPSPDGRRRAVVLSRDAHGNAALWLLGGEPLRLRPLRRLTSPVLAGTTGCGWVGADTFALTRRVEGRARVVLAHTSSGELSVLDPVGESGNDYVLLTAPRSGRLLVASDARGALELVATGVTRGSPRRFLESAERLDGTVTALAMDPSGTRVLLQAQRGLRSSLHVLSLTDGELRQVPTPEGFVSGPAAWVEDDDGAERIHCLLTSPSSPFEILRLPPGGDGRADRIDDGRPVGRARRWAGARVESFPGPAGPIEALVHGREDWRAAERLVIALHGGPERAWQLRHQPLLQYLAEAGITVIAPNQRGSVGYGDAHRRAIHGRWGGPDLEDIRSIGRHVRAERGARQASTPALLGRSYGAFLALLAACCEPDAWSRVAVVAPFLSGERLHREANEKVRAMLDRLGARAAIDDRIGPRDVLRLLPALRAPLLVMHGTEDDVVPVGQSRALRQRLMDLGWAPGEDFAYAEVPGAGHDPIEGSETRHRRLAAFLAAGLSAEAAQMSPVPRIEGGWGQRGARQAS